MTGCRCCSLSCAICFLASGESTRGPLLVLGEVEHEGRDFDLVVQTGQQRAHHLVHLVQGEVLADLLRLARVLLAAQVLLEDGQARPQQPLDVGPVEVVWSGYR